MNSTNDFVVITGAASGIGRALCHNYKSKSAVIYAIDKNQEGLRQLQIDMHLTEGYEFYSSAVDLSVSEMVQTLAADILEKIKDRRLILINNAGANLISGFLKDTPIDEFHWLLRTNLWSVIQLTQLLLPYMYAKNDGHIVNVSSVFGLFGVKTCVPYCTSKFAVRGYTEALRMELKTSNIQITCVHPGGIQTDINRNSRLAGDVVNADTQMRIDKRFQRQARTSPEQAANVIIRGIEKRKKRVLIGADAKILDIIVRLFPENYHQVLDVLAKLFYPSSLNNIEEVYDKK